MFGAFFGATGTITVMVYPDKPKTVPVPSPYAPTSPQRVDHTAAAIGRLCQQFKGGL